MRVLIEFTPPRGATFDEIRSFITTELESAGGSRHPADPLFLSLDDVRVSKPVNPWRNPLKPKKAKLTEVRNLKEGA